MENKEEGSCEDQRVRVGRYREMKSERYGGHRLWTALYIAGEGIGRGNEVRGGLTIMYINF